MHPVEQHDLDKWWWRLDGDRLTVGGGFSVTWEWHGAVNALLFSPEFPEWRRALVRRAAQLAKQGEMRCTD